MQNLFNPSREDRDASKPVSLHYIVQVIPASRRYGKPKESTIKIYLQNRRSDFLRNHERLLFNYFKIVVEQCSFPHQKPLNNTQGPW